VAFETPNLSYEDFSVCGCVEGISRGLLDSESVFFVCGCVEGISVSHLTEFDMKHLE